MGSLVRSTTEAPDTDLLPEVDSTPTEGEPVPDAPPEIRRETSDIRTMAKSILAWSATDAMFLFPMTFMPIVRIIRDHRQEFHPDHAWIQCMLLMYVTAFVLTVPVETVVHFVQRHRERNAAA